MPLLEEISDSENVDDMDFDLAEFDPNLRTAIAPKLEKTIVRSQDIEEAAERERLFPKISTHHDDELSEDEIPDIIPGTTKLTDEQIAYIKTMQVIYPCYFDINRSHSEGRRVSKEYAVENPLTQTIIDACQFLNLNIVHEPAKSHPQDFGNPGRVRVDLKHNGQPQHSLIENKRDMMNKIGKYLKEHPTTLKTVNTMPLPAELRGIQIEKLPKIQGHKMNDIVPAHSKFTLRHPATKSLYDQLEAPVIPEAGQQQQQQQQLPKMKNKYMHVRR